ncbi:MAG: hypothetical protein RLZZ283_185 [Candidatus Parcubacteria bacterium]|jgi:hypothetical protein
MSTEQGKWRTNDEWSEVMAAASRKAEVRTPQIGDGYKASVIKDVGFLNKRISTEHRRKRVGGRAFEYSLHIQIEKANQAVRLFNRSLSAGVSDRWRRIAVEDLEND